MSENKDSRTASQKIDDLERVTATLYQTMQELVRVSNELAKIADEVPLLNQAVRLLNRRIEAVIVSAGAPGGITAAAVSENMIKMNVEDLKNQVDNWTKNGSLVPSAADAVVQDDSFLVGVEVNKDGSIFNARIQFPLVAQPAGNQEKLKGAKVGDVIHFEENNPSFQLTELYTVTKPKAPEAAPATPAAPALSVVPSAPAEDSTPAAASPAPAAVPATEAAPVASDTAASTPTTDAPAAATSDVSNSASTS